MRDDETAPAGASDRQPAAVPLVIATTLRESGITGVHTHFRQLKRYLDAAGAPPSLVTPFSWGRPLIAPVFGLRFLLQPVSGAANYWWYRRWHEAFLRRALAATLQALDECVVYVQCPLSARAALRARRGAHQRVVLAVHFRISQSDEWVDKGQIRRDGRLFRAVRRYEKDVISQVDRIVYVSRWGRDALFDWFPEAAAVPSAVIGNFVAPLPTEYLPSEPLGDLVTVGNLEGIKNHAYLFRILAAAKRAGHEYTLDVFGEGPQRGRLERMVRDQGLEQQVRMHGFRSDVRTLLPRYRAYLHASASESLPLAVIEAMAAGLPVLAGATGGIPEIFDDGVEGRFWSLNDPEEAACMLNALLEDDDRRRRMGRAALDRFRREFDAEVVAPRLLSFLGATTAGDSNTAPVRVASLSDPGPH